MLHESTLHLPSLPPQYDVERLQQLFSYDNVGRVCVSVYSHVSSSLVQVNMYVCTKCGTIVPLCLLSIIYLYSLHVCCLKA